jgi:hypothetical protein
LSAGDVQGQCFSASLDATPRILGVRETTPLTNVCTRRPVPPRRQLFPPATPETPPLAPLFLPQGQSNHVHMPEPPSFPGAAGSVCPSAPARHTSETFDRYNSTSPGVDSIRNLDCCPRPSKSARAWPGSSTKHSGITPTTGHGDELPFGASHLVEVNLRSERG